MGFATIKGPDAQKPSARVNCDYYLSQQGMGEMGKL